MSNTVLNLFLIIFPAMVCHYEDKGLKENEGKMYKNLIFFYQLNVGLCYKRSHTAHFMNIKIIIISFFMPNNQKMLMMR